MNRPDLFIDMEYPYSITELEKIIEDDKVISVLAESCGEILGLCIVTIRNKSGMVEKKIAYMDDLCVDESVRGRGIGKKLFLFVSNEAKKRDAERLDLMVWSFNKNKIRMNIKLIHTYFTIYTQSVFLTLLFLRL